MPFFFFTDLQKLQVQTQGGFGVAANSVRNNLEYERFCVTSKHIATADTPVIAVANGQVFIQQDSTNTSLLNLVLKVNQNPPFAFPFVKYFIYRGIKKESLVDSGGYLTPKGSNDLVTSIWEAYEKKNNSGAPSKEILGLSDEINNLPQNTKLDFIFTNSFDDVQLWNVKEGDKLGDFEKDSIGFEIVLGKLFYQPELILARNPITFIESKVLGNNITDAEFFEHWHDKEDILSFIDPAAYFANFYFNSLNVIRGDQKEILKGSNIIDEVISKFLNKGIAYIDIRNEFNFSLNYFKNYGSTNLSTETILKIKWDTSSNPTNENYYQSSWPILIIDSAKFGTLSEDHVNVSLQLPTDEVYADESRVVIFSKAYKTGSDFPVNFDKEEKFIDLKINSGYTEEFKIAIPCNNGNLIASYSVLKYCRRYQQEPQVVTPRITQLVRTHYLDCLFPTILAKALNNTAYSLFVFDEEIYTDLLPVQNFEALFSLAINRDSGNISFLANPVDIKTKEVFRRPLSITNQFTSSVKESYLEDTNEKFESAVLVKRPLTISGEDIDVLHYSTSLSDMEGNFNDPDFRKNLGLNVTAQQWVDIDNLLTSNLTLKYPSYLSLINIEYLEDEYEIVYTSFNIGIKGFKVNGSSIGINEIDTGIKVITYGHF